MARMTASRRHSRRQMFYRNLRFLNVCAPRRRFDEWVPWRPAQMSIVKILVPVTGAERDYVALATAFQTARSFNAHVETLFVHRDPREAAAYSGMTLRPEIVQNLVDAEEEAQKIASQTAQRSFAAAAAEYEVKIVDVPSRLGAATASYREVTGHLSRVVSDAAILCDIVVFPPVLGADRSDVHDAFVRVLTKVGRPVLLSPERKPEHIGRRVAIGWDGRSAAAKALVGALPILEKAAAVELLSVGPSSADARSVEDARDFLAFHEIRCSERVIARGMRPVADTLLDAASTGGFDLLVVGGYGHNRIAESIFGGVTEDIVSHPVIPILMVH
jgi:nucleotide-binding universal stress UspA family protein